MPADSGARVTVVVVSFNTRELLAACLASLADDAASGLTRVVVVDNGSSDGSPALVRDRFPWADLREPEANVGFGRAVNLGAATAKTSFVAAANADVALRPGALAALLDAADRHPGAGALAPRLFLPGGVTQHSVHALPSVRGALAETLSLGPIARRLGRPTTLAGGWDPARPQAVGWATGAFLLLRRDAFEAVGRFDPEQWLYAEDLDLCWRLQRAGHEIHYVPTAHADHAEGAATKTSLGAGRDAHIVDNTFAWIARRRGPWRARANAAVRVCGSSLRVVALTPAALLRPARYRPRRDRALAGLRLYRRGLRPRPSAGTSAGVPNSLHAASPGEDDRSL